MSSIKFTNPGDWTTIEHHLAEATGERFAFAFTDLISNGANGPIVEVVDVVLIDDSEVEAHRNGWSISDDALDRVHNRASTTGSGLIEFHNHLLGPPGFSSTDEKALVPMAAYVADLLGVSYGAAVWAEGTLHAEWWRPIANCDIERGTFSTVIVFGDHLRILNSSPVNDHRFGRQLPLLGPRGQAAIARLRVAVVGAGGTGSHAALQLAHMGFRNVTVLDDDMVEETNLNRLVTADQADLGLPKNLVAKRRMRAVDERCHVQAFGALTPGGRHPELLDVDLIIGCVDHDGARHRLNQIAIAGRIPYVDLATGVDDSFCPMAVGGRVILMRPGRPCLMCLRELDSAEIGRWAKSSDQQALDRLHGYGTGTPNPSVVYLNGLTVSAALAEIAAWVSGSRPPAEWLDIDLIGTSTEPGVHVGPVRLGDSVPNCIDCSRRKATTGAVTELSPPSSQ
jgi:hypothetical protein